jgi:hypothetical protein
VYSVFILEVTQTIIITQSAFHVFGEGYGNFAFYNDVELAWFSVPIITGVGKLCRAKLPLNFYLRNFVVAFIAQTFYAYRISILSQSKWVAAVIMGVCNMLLAAHSLFQRIYPPFSSLFFSSGDQLHQLLFSTMPNYSVSF